MDAAELETCRQSLLRLRDELQSLQVTSRGSGETVELDQTKVGRLSRMDAMQGQQMALETERRRRQQLQKIEGALRRIDAGDYGYCFHCGEEIDTRRLDADPACTRCIHCADL